MKERLKKFIQNNTVKTVGLVLMTGVVTYVAAMKGIDTRMKSGEYRCCVDIKGWDFVKLPESDEISKQEEA